jgi:tetratricopeptide (TPR) repeat protein
MDNDILSGMLTAIKDFVKDAFKGGPGEELKELKYGNNKILIEHGEFSFLALVISGTPPKELRRRMKKTTEQVNKQYYNELKNFTGEIKRLSPIKKIVGEQLFGFEDAGLQMDMNSDSAWNNKGVVLTKLGKYNEALECFDNALKLNPGVSNTWLNRGITLVKLNEYEEAMDCFDRALQLDPGNEAAKRRRNKCWYKWKLLDGRERQMRSRGEGGARPSGGGRPRPRSDDYERQHPKMEYIGGPGALGPVDTGRAPPAGLGSGPAYSSAPASEPPPRCPSCGGKLRFVDEFESWYCDPCDSYPYDD